MTASPHSERKSKGTMLSVTRDLLTERFGADGWQRVLARLSAADRDVIHSAVAIGWYPTSVFMNLFTATEQELGPTRPHLWNELGRGGAERDLTVFHRMFLRMANPAFVAEKVGDYWSRFHTHGTWQSRRVDHGYVGTLRDFQSTTAYCAMLVPYMTRLLELVGAKRVKVVHSECIHRGHKACVFEAKWE